MYRHTFHCIVCYKKSQVGVMGYASTDIASSWHRGHIFVTTEEWNEVKWTKKDSWLGCWFCTYFPLSQTFPFILSLNMLTKETREKAASVHVWVDRNYSFLSSFLSSPYTSSHRFHNFATLQTFMSCAPRNSEGSLNISFLYRFILFDKRNGKIGCIHVQVSC